ncbi:MAG: 4-hydroxy-3-methylbut-2-enyl diphosphate reductase [Candidatus Omnitrophica bacterium]|nr:4-hydroxy-3-methylbut-2-enyl diphosphate reductase [Candidatus Omnitrophota bacterium]
MRIKVAKSAGFCFGVKRAISIAYASAKNNPKVVMLGDIVHNEDVVKDVLKAGIRKVDKLAKTKDKTLLIRAHGASLKTYKLARSLGYKIIDATCPMVKEIHDIAKSWEKKKFPIIVIGDKKHDEVRGITGQIRSKALIIDSFENMPLKKIKKIKKAAVVVQSTQNLEKTLEIVNELKKHIKNLKFSNTICNPTRIKQKEIKLMPLENQLMIIIGSKSSANTRRLYELSKSLNPETYLIQSAKDLKPAWFKKIKTVGITAGASTPDKTTRSVVEKIKSLSK